ncbi:MAG TPA: lipase maturation factor family protein, partial [Parachlamydiaceae bacterium]|nr:lipase maturation factor family protein [Parachlamydiaceae bacterium]
MFSPESYTIALSLFIRSLGAIYFFAFGAFLFQIKGLLGENGILPINGHLSWVKKHYSKRCYKLIPSLFWFNSS